MKCLLEKKAAEEYARGRITLSEAARKADMTLWEMGKYLPAHNALPLFATTE